MIQTDTMPPMDTFMDRQKLVGWVVRDGIISQGVAYTEAARKWPMALPTLNRLMNTGNVGLRFYATAEKNLGLPRGLLSRIADGDVEAIRNMTGLDDALRTYILTELEGGTPPPAPARRRKA